MVVAEIDPTTLLIVFVYLRLVKVPVAPANTPLTVRFPVSTSEAVAIEAAFKNWKLPVPPVSTPTEAVANVEMEGPVGPVVPEGPVRPVAPVGPVAPAAPAGPWGPTSETSVGLIQHPDGETLAPVNVQVPYLFGVTRSVVPRPGYGPQ